MADNNYLVLYYHLVFSTKNRQRTIYPDMEDILYPYILGSSIPNKVSIIRVNGMSDHIHLLICVYSGDFHLSSFVREIKKSTNKYINTTLGLNGSFSWQEGYFASTVSKRNVSAVKQYISNQKQHHTAMPFEEEMVLIFGEEIREIFR